MRGYQLFVIGIAAIFFAGCQKNIGHLEKTGTLKITFKNTVKGVPLQLNSTTYTNSFGEQYTVSKYKFYVSNIGFGGTGVSGIHDGYYLIDQADANSLSISFNAPVNNYLDVSFLIGVDSLHNVSGAQSGALDPLNDMFWTWNSGYIMAKMEGNSPQSPVVNNKVEYHIGGFTGVNSVLKSRGLLIPVPALSSLNIREGKTSEIFIETDLDKWWQGAFNLKIADNPAVTHPGPLAKSIADNYENMFTVTDVKNY